MCKIKNVFKLKELYNFNETYILSMKITLLNLHHIDYKTRVLKNYNLFNKFNNN